MNMELLDVLLIFVPIVIVLGLIGADPTILFVTSLFAILALAAKTGEATEELALRYGGHIGGLLNITFGNAAELIIALLAINAGLIDLVKASLTGSIIGNLLFVFGLSMFFGGLRHKEQKFSEPLAGLNSTMLLIAFVSLMTPSLFHFIEAGQPQDEATLSLAIAILLLAIYLLSLAFSLKTHSYLFTFDPAGEKPEWGRNFSLAVLLGSTALLFLVGGIFVNQVPVVAKSIGMTEFFIGAVIIALVGNAAEHIAAIFFALKNRIDMSVNVTVGSSLQVAMFIAPIAVIASALMGRNMNLIFTPFEVLAVFAGVIIVNEITTDGKCNWFEGAQLAIMYVIIAVLFFFIK